MSEFHRREFLEEKGLTAIEAHVTQGDDGCEMGIVLTDGLNQIEFQAYDRADFGDRQFLDEHLGQVQILHDLIGAYLIAAHDERMRMVKLAAAKKEE
jgi:hypothetical protein